MSSVQTLVGPSPTANDSIVIWGSGSYSRMLVAYLRRIYPEGDVLIVDPETSATSSGAPRGLFSPTSERELRQAIEGAGFFIVAVGGSSSKARVSISEYLFEQGLHPFTLVFGGVAIDPDASLGIGTVVLPGAVVGPYCSTGAWSIVNSASVLSHDCSLGTGAHLMPGAVLGGRAGVGDMAVVGMNSTVLPDIRVGDGTVVGAGSVVTKELPPRVMAFGIPARISGVARDEVAPKTRSLIGKS